MIRVTKLQKSFGGQLIFRSADWFVGKKDRVALIGPNGSGKSTLLKIIAGQEGHDAGTVEMGRSLRVGYLAQSGFVLGTGTVREEAREAFQEILDYQTELGALETRLSRAEEHDRDVERLTLRHSELLERLAILGAHEMDRRLHQVLTGLGFRQTDFDRPVGQLSGGWQMRVALARILLRKPHVLMLDEPTNHLDLEAREWLERYLQDYPYAVVLVSHDRHFLDVTVRRASEIVGYRFENYAGNYSFYEKERQKRYELRHKAYEQQQAEIRRLKQFIQRNRANKRMASRTHSRMLVLEKMERLERPTPPGRGIRLRYPHCPHSGKIAMDLRGVSKTYGELCVFSDVDLRIVRGGRIALVGPNGAGKSTLMRILAGRERPDEGECIPGYRAHIAFFEQEEGLRFERNATVIEAVTDLAPIDFVPEVRSLLGAFLFSGDAVDKRTGSLSGGELNRLAIAALLVRPSNILLLDEPTNHLDIVSKDALLESLRHYPGTIVFVSHDRHFLDQLTMHVVAVGNGGIQEYPGTYDDYLWHRSQNPGEPSPSPAAGPARSSRVSQPSRASAPGNHRRRRVIELEATIADLEARKRRYTDALADPLIAADRDKAAFYLAEMRTIDLRLEALYRQWESQQGQSR